MSDLQTTISTGSYEARVGLARTLAYQSTVERSNTSDEQYTRDLNDAALLAITAILVKLAPLQNSSDPSSEKGSQISTTADPVPPTRIEDGSFDQHASQAPISQLMGVELASVIDLLTQLVCNSQITLNDLPTPIPYIADPYIRSSLQSLGYTHPHPVNVTKLCHRLMRSLLQSFTKPNEMVPRSRGSSPARANPLNFRLDGIDECTSSSLTKLFNAFSVNSALSSPPSNSTDSPVSSPRSHSVLDLTTEDSATAPSESPLTSPALSSDDIPCSGNKHAPQAKARNILLDHVQHPSPPRTKPFPRVQSGMTSPSESSCSSPSMSTRRHLRDGFYTRPRSSSLLSLCPSIASNSNSQNVSPKSPVVQKSEATVSLTPLAKSSMGSFTPVPVKSATGSLRSHSLSSRTNRTGPLSWLTMRLKTEFSTEWHDGKDDEYDIIDSEDFEHDSTSSDDGHRRTTIPHSTSRRLSMKRSGNEIPSLCLTQSTFTQPSPLSALFVPPSKQRKPSFTSFVPAHSPSPSSPSKQSGANPSLRKQMLEGRHQLSTRSQTMPAGPRAEPITNQSQGKTSALSTSPRRCATSPPSSLDPALAALEKNCRLNTKVRCSNCNISGRNFPTARNGETFCSRECRIALKEKRSSDPKGKGKATSADVAVL